MRWVFAAICPACRNIQQGMPALNSCFPLMQSGQRYGTTCYGGISALPDDLYDYCVSMG
jgi:hypothetical protein